jgi:hypothetical protein
MAIVEQVSGVEKNEIDIMTRIRSFLVMIPTKNKQCEHFRRAWTSCWPVVQCRCAILLLVTEREFGVEWKLCLVRRGLA